MVHQVMTPQERYAALVEAFLGDHDVEQSGRGFGADALKVRGKIFAMLAGVSSSSCLGNGSTRSSNPAKVNASIRAATGV